MTSELTTTCIPTTSGRRVVLFVVLTTMMWIAAFLTPALFAQARGPILRVTPGQYDIDTKVSDTSEYDVPFFVTGYYRPNTPENLDELGRSINTRLRGAGYIERISRGSARHREYATYAERVEAVFAALSGPATHDLFTTIAASNRTNDIVEITVTGYADPNEFSGTYVERETVTFFDLNGVEHILGSGTTIGNLELSGLRAVHTGRYVDSLLQRATRATRATEATGATRATRTTMGAAEVTRAVGATAAAVGSGSTELTDGPNSYAALRAQGRVRFRYVAAGVRNDGDQYELQRRVKVSIVRRTITADVPVVASSAAH